MKTEVTMRHWLHIILLLVTMGFYAPVYLVIAANTQRTNELVRSFNEGYNAGQLAWMRDNANRHS